ncbi:MAG: hypothetical protein KAW17_12850 [Candidatus Eisenbacteria sp.]|nr:hypothetical protein [Candidatus Eisenbacteria bacterium]
MESRSRTLLLAFALLYVLHVAYGMFYLDRVEGVQLWLRPLVFLIGLNALGFLVWITRHRWVVLGNILIHLVGALGEVKNMALGGGVLKIPTVVTHGLMVVIFLWIYLRSR